MPDELTDSASLSSHDFEHGAELGLNNHEPLVRLSQIICRRIAHCMDQTLARTKAALDSFLRPISIGRDNKLLRVGITSSLPAIASRADDKNGFVNAVANTIGVAVTTAADDVAHKHVKLD